MELLHRDVKTALLSHASWTLETGKHKLVRSYAPLLFTLNLVCKEWREICLKIREVVGVDHAIRCNVVAEDLPRLRLRDVIFDGNFYSVLYEISNMSVYTLDLCENSITWGLASEWRSLSSNDVVHMRFDCDTYTYYDADTPGHVASYKKKMYSGDGTNAVVKHKYISESKALPAIRLLICLNKSYGDKTWVQPGFIIAKCIRGSKQS